MKNLIVVLLLFLSTLCCLGQAADVTVKGTVTDARTGKGVKANVRYGTIPSAGINGRFNDSTFLFMIFGSADYQITASETIIITPHDIDVNRSIFRNIKLTPEGQTMVLEDLIFAQGKSAIDSKSYASLNEIAQMMKENTTMEIQLEGHTDNIGSPKANLSLSQERVDAVKKYLVSKGIHRNRIQTKAFGGTQPLANEMTPEARAKNRRVEMRILRD
jgi:outer membrane protein OmpA-like peptidoglycan-associated protein